MPVTMKHMSKSKKEKRRKESNSCIKKEKVAQFDNFGTSIGFNFSEESSNYTSLCGSILTCSIMLLTFAFTLQSIVVLNGRKGTVFTTTLEKEANEGRALTKDDGLQFAIGILDFGTSNWTDYYGRDFEEYLSLDVHQYKFRLDPSLNSRQKLESHPCTEEELGLVTSSESNFFPHTESSKAAIGGKAHLFHCFDQETISIMNDGNSFTSDKLEITFNIPHEQCQNDEFDLKDLQCDPGVYYDLALTNKWIVLLYNQKRFISDNYEGGSKTLKKETHA